MERRLEHSLTTRKSFSINEFREQFVKMTFGRKLSSKAPSETLMKFGPNGPIYNTFTSILQLEHDPSIEYTTEIDLDFQDFNKIGNEARKNFLHALQHMPRIRFRRVTAKGIESVFRELSP